MATSTIQQRKYLSTVAIIIAIAAGAYAIGRVYPPLGLSAGTIGPADRYVASQVGAGDVTLGDTAIPRLMQTDAFEVMVGTALVPSGDATVSLTNSSTGSISILADANALADLGFADASAYVDSGVSQYAFSENGDASVAIVAAAAGTAHAIAAIETPVSSAIYLDIVILKFPHWSLYTTLKVLSPADKSRFVCALDRPPTAQTHQPPEQVGRAPRFVRVIGVNFKSNGYRPRFPSIILYICI